ncbi:hypothetical protein GW796_00425 [archaeon]|nr:hypothetical protein [archaeon]
MNSVDNLCALYDTLSIGNFNVLDKYSSASLYTCLLFLTTLLNPDSFIKYVQASFLIFNQSTSFLVKSISHSLYKSAVVFHLA